MTLADGDTNLIQLMMPIQNNPWPFVINTLYMQVALVADDQTKIVGILEVKWNTNLFTRNMGIRLQEVYKVGKERLKVLTLDFFVLAAKIIQALDSKPGSFNHTCISCHLQNDICHG